MNSIPLARLEEVLEEIETDAERVQESSGDQPNALAQYLLRGTSSGMSRAVNRIYSLIWKLQEEEE